MMQQGLKKLSEDDVYQLGMKGANQITYILQKGNKYYCGKTNDLNRRMREHNNGRWSGYIVILTFAGDYEKQIKRAGINLIVELFRRRSAP